MSSPRSHAVIPYDLQNPESRDTTSTSPTLQSRRGITNPNASSSYEEGLSKVLSLVALESNKLRELETLIDQVQKNKKIEPMAPTSN